MEGAQYQNYISTAADDSHTSLISDNAKRSRRSCKAYAHPLLSLPSRFLSMSVAPSFSPHSYQSAYEPAQLTPYSRYPYF
jgi:hypothetical protein